MSTINGRSVGATSKLAVSLAWLQLIISVAMASTIVWCYLSYQASMGQFIQGIATTIGAVSNVVVRTAESIEARQDHIDEVGKLLITLRESINAFASASESQRKMIPQYAASVRSVSDATGEISKTLDSISPHLKIGVPSGVQMNGLKPVLTMSYPLEVLSPMLKANVLAFKTNSETLQAIAQAIERDGGQMTNTTAATTGQALKVIRETEKTLERLNAQDLPKAISDLRDASKDMGTLRTQMGLVGHVGTALLVVGLLLSAWCFLNSLSVLILTKPNAVSISEASVT